MTEYVTEAAMPTVLEKVGTAQAARICGLSEQRIRQLAVAGVLPCEETPLGRLFAVDELHAFVAQREAAQRRGKRG